VLIRSVSWFFTLALPQEWLTRQMERSIAPIPARRIVFPIVISFDLLLSNICRDKSSASWKEMLFKIYRDLCKIFLSSFFRPEAGDLNKRSRDLKKMQGRCPRIAVFLPLTNRQSTDYII
jgi:hypothetical protein